MENTEILRKYELVVIIDAKLTQEQKDEICKEVTDTIAKAEGKVINSQVWMEKHKFTFEIKKLMEGTYYLFNIEGTSSMNKKIDTILRLNEKVLRFSITRSN